MESAQSIDERLDQHGSTDVDVPTSKSKYGSHSSLTSTNSASSLATPVQLSHRKSHPLLSNRCSASDSRLSSSVDNLQNPKRSSRSKNRLRRLDLSLDSNPVGLRRSRHDPNSSTAESTEDEDRTSADEYSTEDDSETSLRQREGAGEGGGNNELNKSINSSLNSSTFFVDKAVEELVTTERTYVKDLHDVIQVAVPLVFALS